MQINIQLIKKIRMGKNEIGIFDIIFILPGPVLDFVAEFTIGCVVIVLNCSACAIIEGSLSFVIDSTGRCICATVGITI